MKVWELIELLQRQAPSLEVVINMSNEEAEGFILCPLAKVEEIKTDSEEEYIMLTGLEYHATTAEALN